MPNPSRRGFLGFLGAAVASATLDPERLLWVPGEKLISIPKAKEPLLQTIELRPSLIADWRSMEQSMLKKFPGREFYDVQGQEMFPSYDKNGNLESSYVAFLLASDWKNRKQEFDQRPIHSRRPDYVIYA